MTAPQPAEAPEDADAPGGVFELLRDTLREQCASPEVQQAVFRPLMRWFLWNMLPYVLLFVGVHFFTTVGAISLVMMWMTHRIKN